MRVVTVQAPNGKEILDDGYVHSLVLLHPKEEKGIHYLNAFSDPN